MSGFQSNGIYDVVLLHWTKKTWNDKETYNVNEDALTLTAMRRGDVLDIEGTADLGFFHLFASTKVTPAALYTLSEQQSILKHFIAHPATMERYMQHLTDPYKKPLYLALKEDARLMGAACFLQGLGIYKWHKDKEVAHPKLVLALADALMTTPYKILNDDRLHEYLRYVGPHHMTCFRWIDQHAQKLYGKRVNEQNDLFDARVESAIISMLEQEEAKGHTWSDWVHIGDRVAQSLHRLPKDVEKVAERLMKTQSTSPRSFAVYGRSGNLLPNIFQRAPTRRLEQKVRELFSQNVSPQPYDENVLSTVLRHLYDDRGKQRDEYQVLAIRNALQYPLSFISGPPGSGKTSSVILAVVMYHDILYAKELAAIKAQAHQRSAADTIKFAMAKSALHGTYSAEDVCEPEEEQGDGDDADDADDDDDDDESQDESDFAAVLKRKFLNLHRRFQRLPTSTDTSLVKLTAPSGVAARRLSAACDNHPSHTCHAFSGQLLEDQCAKARKKRGRLDRDFYPFKMWIVDEASMLDLSMFVQIVETARKENASLLFVGDANQLPPIGNAQVFQDIIEFALMPSVRLVNIYRQGNGSGIAHLSSQVMAGVTYSYSQIRDDPRFSDVQCVNVIEGASEQDWEKAVTALWKTLTDNGHTSSRTTQFLTPMNKGPGGRKSINEAMQRLVHSLDVTNTAIVWDKRNVRYHEGDPVIHLKNNYKLDLRNGDTGKVVDPAIGFADIAALYENANDLMNAVVDDTTDVLYVRYGSKVQPYIQSADAKNKELRKFANAPPFWFASIGDLDLAYCITAHKSQGSEYDNVVLLIPRLGPAGFVCDKLINTMVSRAKSRLVIMAPQELWHQACHTRYICRRTRLNRPSLFG